MQRIKRHLMSSTLLAALAAGNIAYAHDHDDTSAKVRPEQAGSGQAANQAGTANQSENSSNAQAAPKKRTAIDPALASYSTDQIKELQRQLAARGAYQGQVDGVAGPMTAAALRNFQVQQKLDTSAGLNAETRDALGLEWERTPVSGTELNTGSAGQTELQPAVGGNTPTLQLRSMNTEQAKALQQRLRDYGYYRGEVDGMLGEQTRAALQHFFQDQAALAQQGVISQATVTWFNAGAPAAQPQQTTPATTD